VCPARAAAPEPQRSGGDLRPEIGSIAKRHQEATSGAGLCRCPRITRALSSISWSRLRPEVDVNATLGDRRDELSRDELIEYLTQEHRRMDERLRQLARQISMTATEQIEYARLKKQKLATKDRLARLT
jgi:hypothetical protein